MTTLTRRAALGLVPLAALAGCQTTKTTSTGTMNPDDQQFVTDAFNIIAFDREECTIAQKQARMPEIRAIAVDLLQQANDFDMKLQPIAAAAGIKPPTVLRSNLRVRAARLRLGQGLDFDRAFLEDQIASHQDALNAQENVMATPGSDPQLQELSKQGTAIIRTNLARLRELQGKMMTMKTPR